MTTPTTILDTLARLTQRIATVGGKRRVVLRFDRIDVARLDMLARRLSRPDLGDRVSRAAVVRALAVWGLAEVERIAPGTTVPPAANDNADGAP